MIDNEVVLDQPTGRGDSRRTAAGLGLYERVAEIVRQNRVDLVADELDRTRRGLVGAKSFGERRRERADAGPGIQYPQVSFGVREQARHESRHGRRRHVLTEKRASLCVQLR